MKKTLTTIALTTVVVLTVVGIFGSMLGKRVNNTFSAISSELPAEYGMGGGAAPVEMPAAAPAQDMFQAPSVGGGDAKTISNALNEAPSSIADNGTRLVIRNADMALVVKDPKAWPS